MKKPFAAIASAVSVSSDPVTLNVKKVGDLELIGKLTANDVIDAKKDVRVAGVLNATKIQQKGQDLIPKGTIVLWSGREAPKGWVLADGKNGTPDLTGRFIIGSRLDQVNEKGEHTQHDHRVNVKTNESKTPERGEGKHDHKTTTLKWYENKVESGDEVTVVDAYANKFGDVRNSRTDFSGEHFHTIPELTVDGKTQLYTGEIRPRWYALAYIMKI